MSKKRKDLDPAILEAIANDKSMGAAIKVALAVIGIGVAAGATLVVGMDQIMKRIFVSDSWPDKEWSNNEWAQEELE